MCGFAVFQNHSTHNPTDEKLLDEVFRTIYLRGPDSKGRHYCKKSKIDFLHTRLAIQDLSKSGNQPMLNKEEKNILVYNGEIYNHLEIRESHFSANKSWSGHSDTETLYELLLNYGLDDTLLLIDGMFSFVYYDQGQNKIYAARDPLGQKPLYYSFFDQGFFIGSMIQSVLPILEVKPTIDLSAVERYFKFGFIPSPYTIYKNVFKLAANHILVYDLEKNSHHVYKAAFETQRILNSGQNFVSHMDFISEMTQAVNSTILSDVDISLLLSGGIDSSVVGSLLKNNKELMAYTAIFDDEMYSEEGAVSKFLEGTLLNHKFVDINENNTGEDIRKFVAFNGEPLADTSQIPANKLLLEVAKSSKVVITGDGGDEFFCGYERYLKVAKNWVVLERIPHAFRKIAANIIHFLINVAGLTIRKWGHILFRYRDLDLKLFKLALSLESSNLTECYENLLYSSNVKFSKLFLHKPSDKYLLPEEPSEIDPVGQFMNLDRKYFLPDKVLTKMDRICMMHSVENRTPFLSKSIIEFSNKFNTSDMYAAGKGKLHLRGLLEKIGVIVSNQKKSGFTPPLRDILSKEFELDFYPDSLEKSSISKIINVKYISRVYSQYLKGDRRNEDLLWRFLVFKIWLN